jgi:hypothetical protein
VGANRVTLRVFEYGESPPPVLLCPILVTTLDAPIAVVPAILLGCSFMVQRHETKVCYEIHHNGGVESDDHRKR